MENVKMFSSESTMLSKAKNGYGRSLGGNIKFVFLVPYQRLFYETI